MLISFPSTLLAFKNCDNVIQNPYTDEIKTLSEQVTTIVGEVATKVLSIKVNYDGTGSVKVLTDGDGNLLGLMLDYKDSKGVPMQQTKTIDQFNKGESVAFTMEGQSENPLILKNKPGTLISKTNGGTFDFALLSDTDPSKFIHYPLSLVKVAGIWRVMKGTKVVTSTIISPNISWSLSWEGTFKSATFQ